MRDPKSKIIGDTEYTVTPLGALKGRAVLYTLVQAVGPALSKGDVGALLGALPPETFASLCDTFAGTTTVKLPNGKAPRLSDIFDAHFAANYGAMVRWLTFAVEVNFSDFFADVGELLAGALRKAPSA